MRDNDQGGHEAYAVFAGTIDEQGVKRIFHRAAAATADGYKLLMPVTGFLPGKQNSRSLSDCSQAPAERAKSLHASLLVDHGGSHGP
jgi:hypothetical protein